jgi:putative membrane protein
VELLALSIVVQGSRHFGGTGGERRMPIRTTARLCIVALRVAGGALAQAAPAEQSYVQSAQTINQAELALGQLAQQRGSSDEVKQMARNMVDRHSALSAQLADLARERAIPTAQHPSTVDDRAYVRLGKLSGTSFDEAFKQAVADAHTRELALHRGEIERGGDAGLRSYAQSRVSALEASMEQAKDEW